MIEFIKKAKPTHGVRSYLNGCEPEVASLVQSLLFLDPQHRISVKSALQHKYLQHLHCPDDEPIGPKAKCAADFAFENHDLTIRYVLIILNPRINAVLGKSKSWFMTRLIVIE